MWNQAEQHRYTSILVALLLGPPKEELSRLLYLSLALISLLVGLLKEIVEFVCVHFKRPLTIPSMEGTTQTMKTSTTET
jgi:hypothetical protein